MAVWYTRQDSKTGRAKPDIVGFSPNAINQNKNPRQAEVIILVHAVGLEPTTLCSEDRCSNPLSYACTFYF